MLRMGMEGEGVNTGCMSLQVEHMCIEAVL